MSSRKRQESAHSITEESLRQMMLRMDDLPLPKRRARVCCLGCGENVVVDAGHERAARAEMKVHALTHEQALSDDLRSHEDWLGDLISTVTIALPREDWLD